MDPEVPLVVPEVNPSTLDRIPKGIVANPNCTTMAAMPVLKPLHDAAGLRAAGRQHLPGGVRRRGDGVAELDEQVRKVADGAAALALDGTRRRAARRRSKFAEPIAFNVIPLAGSHRRRRLARDRRGAEAAQREPQDPRDSRAAVSGICVRVPVFTGHSLAINAGFAGPISPERGARAPAQARPASSSPTCPTPLEAAGRDPPTSAASASTRRVDGTGLSLFVVGDNLRKGAALNAVQIAEALLTRR